MISGPFSNYLYIYIIPQNYAKVKRNQKIVAPELYNFYKSFEESEGDDERVSLRNRQNGVW